MISQLEEKAGKKRRKKKRRGEPFPIEKTRSGGGKKSKRKGDKFQNVIAKQFASYFGGAVRSTPGSGGWATVGGFGPPGDLVFGIRKAPYHIECFGGQTLILTADGFRPIKSIQEGDRVATHAPHSNSTFKHVTAVMKRRATAHEMRLPSGGCIWVTEDHPFEAFSGWQSAKQTTYTAHVTKTAFLEAKWLPCAMAKIEDDRSDRCACGCGELLYRIDAKGRPRRFIRGHLGAPRKEIPERIRLDESMCFLLGLFIAEGHVNKVKSRVIWTFHRDEIDLHTSVVKTIKQAFDIDAKIYHDKLTLATHISANSSQMADTFMTWLGTGSRRKRLGKLVHLDKPRLRALVRALFLGDGCVGERFARYETVSWKLASDIQMALLRLGIATTITTNHVGDRGVRKSNIHSVQVRRESMTRFGAQMGFECTRKDRHPSYDSNIVWEPSKRRLWMRGASFTGNSKEMTVYNLTVDQDETYVIQGGVVVHNCKKQENWDLADLITGKRSGDTTSTNSLEKWWKQTIRDCPKKKYPMLIFARNLAKAAKGRNIGVPPLLMMRQGDFRELGTVWKKRSNLPCKQCENVLLKGMHTCKTFAKRIALWCAADFIPHLTFSDDTGTRIVCQLSDFFRFVKPPKCSPRRKQWKRGIG